MPGTAEIARSLTGAWRLLRFDASGMNFFDLSIDGFWRSFFAAVIALPMYILFVAVSFDGTDAGLFVFVLVKGIAYVAGWAAFPIAMIGIARLLGLTQNYVAFIVAANWAGVLQSAVFVPVNLVAATGALASDGGAFLYLATLVIVLVYQWFIARTALQTTVTVASAVVLIDVFLGLIVAVAFARLV